MYKCHHTQFLQFYLKGIHNFQIFSFLIHHLDCSAEEETVVIYVYMHTHTHTPTYRSGLVT